MKPKCCYSIQAMRYHLHDGGSRDLGQWNDAQIKAIHNGRFGQLDNNDRTVLEKWMAPIHEPTPRELKIGKAFESWLLGLTPGSSTDDTLTQVRQAFEAGYGHSRNGYSA